MKKWTYALLALAVLGSALVLSGCFPMQTTLSYFFYNEATPPASIAHVDVYLKTINANSVVSTTINSEVDLVSNDLNQIQQAISLNTDSAINISSLTFSLGPVATVVYDDGTTRTLDIATSVTANFYGYSSQQYQAQPMTILKGSNKSAVVLWNLSALSTPLNLTFWTPQARVFDRDSLVKLEINLPYSETNYYTASVSDFGSSYAFTANGYLDALGDTYEFVLYPFKAPTSNGYTANVTVNTATDTVNSTTITINTDPITINL